MAESRPGFPFLPLGCLDFTPFVFVVVPQTSAYLHSLLKNQKNACAKLVPLGDKKGRKHHSQVSGTPPAATRGGLLCAQVSPSSLLLVPRGRTAGGHLKRRQCRHSLGNGPQTLGARTTRCRPEPDGAHAAGSAPSVRVFGRWVQLVAHLDTTPESPGRVAPGTNWVVSEQFKPAASPGEGGSGGTVNS